MLAPIFSFSPNEDNGEAVLSISNCIKATQKWRIEDRLIIIKDKKTEFS